MAHHPSSVASFSSQSVLQTNRVLRNTYFMLALTLLFSAGTAYAAIITNAPPLGIGALLGYMALLFLTSATRNSPFGIVAVFALTGFMGYTLGPLLNFYLHAFSNGSQIIATAFGGTGMVFLGLSAYTLTTRKDFSYLAGFMMSLSMIMLLSIIVMLFFPMPVMHLAISCGFLLFSSMAIMFETSNIIHGGVTNYLEATVSLYVSIFNIFVSLLHILSAFAGSRD